MAKKELFTITGRESHRTYALFELQEQDLYLQATYIHTVYDELQTASANSQDVEPVQIEYFELDEAAFATAGVKNRLLFLANADA